MTQNVWDELVVTNNITKNTLNNILLNNGIIQHRSLPKIHNGFVIFDVEYFQGKQIANAYKTGLVDELNASQTATLESALEIVEGISGTEIDKEKWIHDVLQDRIAYFLDEDDYNEDDCAIGALLNGKANCDGYSDAFYLCCTLAGLKVRYNFGKIINLKNLILDHMWNLVLIDNKWLMVDLTIDDETKSYRYFNVGTNQIEKDHIWDDKLLINGLFAE